MTPNDRRDADRFTATFAAAISQKTLQTKDFSTMPDAYTGGPHDYTDETTTQRGREHYEAMAANAEKRLADIDDQERLDALLATTSVRLNANELRHLIEGLHRTTDTDERLYRKLLLVLLHAEERLQLRRDTK